MSLTTDVWSDPDLISFLGATAHFIVRRICGQLESRSTPQLGPSDESENQLVLRSGLLAFRHIQGSHTGENLACVLFNITKDAGIAKRVR